MKRTWVRINSENHTDVLINPDRVTFVEETTDGCVIHFDRGNRINTTAPFEDTVDAMERSGAANED